MGNLEGVTLSIFSTVSWRKQKCHGKCGLLSAAHERASPQRALSGGQIVEKQKPLWPHSLSLVKAKTKQ